MVDDGHVVPVVFILLEEAINSGLVQFMMRRLLIRGF